VSALKQFTKTQAIKKLRLLLWVVFLERGFLVLVPKYSEQIWLASLTVKSRRCIVAGWFNKEGQPISNARQQVRISDSSTSSSIWNNTHVFGVIFE